MDTMASYEDVSYLKDWLGIPFGDGEGELISIILGKNKNAALLGHHGLIVTGSTIEQATYYYIF